MYCKTILMYQIKLMEATAAADYALLRLETDAFSQNESIPARYTCDGININPSLDIDHIPEKAKSLAVIVDDPDAPTPGFCHWVIWNIPVTHHIRERENRGAQGMNDFGRHQYDGPCPPSGTHRYYFKVYALDASLEIPVSVNKAQLEKAMSDHILGFGVLVGKYAHGRTASS